MAWVGVYSNVDHLLHDVGRFGTSGECLGFVKVPDAHFLGKVTLLCHRGNDECVKRGAHCLGHRQTQVLDTASSSRSWRRWAP